MVKLNSNFSYNWKGWKEIDFKISFKEKQAQLHDVYRNLTLTMMIKTSYKLKDL